MSWDINLWATSIPFTPGYVFQTTSHLYFGNSWLSDQPPGDLICDEDCGNPKEPPDCTEAEKAAAQLYCNELNSQARFGVSVMDK